MRYPVSVFLVWASLLAAPSLALAEQSTNKARQAQSSFARSDRFELPKGWHVHENRGSQYFRAPDESIKIEVLARGDKKNLKASQYLNNYLSSFGKDYARRSGKIKILSGKNYQLAYQRIVFPDSPALVCVVTAPGFPKQLATISLVKKNINKIHRHNAIRIVINASVPLNGLASNVAKERQQREDRRSVATAPGKGIPNSQLHGVSYDKGDLRYDTFSGIWREVGGSTQLLLKDGWAYRSPSIAPADLNVKVSRKLEPRRWSQWRNNSRVANATLFKPTKPGTRFNVSVYRTQTSGNRTSTSNRHDYFKLTSNGRFETSMTSLTSANMQGSTVNIAKSENKRGSSTQTTGNTRTPAGEVTTRQSTRSAANNPDRSGSYRINGHTIELRYDNGVVVRKLFATDARTLLILGGTRYWM